MRMGEEEEDAMMSKMVPLCMLNPGLHVSNRLSSNRRLSVLSSPSARTSRFRLPQDWTKKKLRTHADGPRPNKLLRQDEKDFTSTTAAATSPFILPEGWVVEKVARKDQGFFKYYYEPGTGRRFRSLVAVERHLEEGKDENAPLPQMFEMGNLSKKRKMSGTSAFGFTKPPDKIKWVLNDSCGLAWNPLTEKQIVPVPDRVKNQWALRFMQFMGGGSPVLKR